MATKKKRTVDDEIDHVLESMKSMKVDSDEYGKAVDNLKILKEAQSYKKAWKFPVDLDTIIVAVTAIGQTVMILNHEELHVISSKALGYILKGRI